MSSDVKQVGIWMRLRQVAVGAVFCLICFVAGALLWKQGICWAWNAVWRSVWWRLYDIGVAAPREIVWALFALWCLGYILYRDSKRMATGHRRLKNEDLFSASDAPIECAREDLFSRGAYVQMLATLIMGKCDERGSRYIGVYAPWGEGKTSVRNLLGERIRTEYGDRGAVIVDFYPWRYSGAESARFAFFERIAKSVAKSGNGRLAFLFKQCSKLMMLQRYDKSVGTIHDVVDWVRSLWFAWVMPEEDVLDCLRVLLSHLDFPVIIVVDDLDRLPQDDVNEIICFLKSRADFPNLTYLILADEEYLAASVSKMIQRPDMDALNIGRQYLEKIIPIRCPLPAINGWRIFDEFKRRLANMLGAYAIKVENPFDGCDWVSPYLSNARQAKRLLNAFSVQLATYKKKVGEQTYLNVHIGDLLVLTALRTFECKFYDVIWDGYMTLLKSSWRYSDGDGRMSSQWMDEHFYNYVKSDHRPRIESFIRDRLGVTSDGGGPYDQKPKEFYLANPQDPVLVLNYRLASEYCFENYFLMEFENVQLPQAEVEDFLADIRNDKVPEDQLRRLDREGRLPYLLYALEGIDPFESRDISDCYMQTLIRAGTWDLTSAYLPEHYETGFGTKFSVYVRLYRCLLFYCQKLKTKIMGGTGFPGVKRIGDLLLPFLKAEGDVVVSARMIGYDSKYHRSSDAEIDAFFDDAEYVELKRLYLRQIEQVQIDGRLMRHVDFFDLFRCWWFLLNEFDEKRLFSRFRKACANVIDDVESLVKVIKFFADDNRDTGCVGGLEVTVRLDSMEKFFGKLLVKALLRRMKAMPGLDEYDSKFLSILAWAVERKRHKLPYGQKEQEAHIRQAVNVVKEVE